MFHYCAVQLWTLINKYRQVQDSFPCKCIPTCCCWTLHLAIRHYWVVMFHLLFSFIKIELTDQRICMKFCSKFGKKPLESWTGPLERILWVMLKLKYGINALNMTGNQQYIICILKHLQLENHWKIVCKLQLMKFEDWQSI